MNKWMETLCLPWIQIQQLKNSTLTHHMVSNQDENCWSPIWLAWSDMNGGSPEGSRMKCNELQLFLNTKDRRLPYPEPESIALGPGEGGFQTGMHLCFWRSFHISMSHTSDTQWHTTSQKPNVPRSRISHPENLEGTPSDLASAGTLTLYSFHELLAMSHSPPRLPPSLVLWSQQCSGNTE